MTHWIPTRQGTRVPQESSKDRCREHIAARYDVRGAHIRRVWPRRTPCLHYAHYLAMLTKARKFVEFGHDELKLIWEPDVHITNLHQDMDTHENF